MTLALEEPLGFFEASYFLGCREIAEAMEFSSSGSIQLDNGKVGTDSKSCSRNEEEADIWRSLQILPIGRKGNMRRKEPQKNFPLTWFGADFDLVGINWIKVVLGIC